jgi:hypothetical protein
MPDDGSITIKLDERTARQLAERAREEGVSPEQYAAELVAEQMAADDGEPRPPLSISDEELRASIEQQRRDIAAGTATLYSHEEVMAGARAILAKARDAKP